MNQQRMIPAVLASLTVALFLTCSSIPFMSMWGVNHLLYLPDLVRYSLMGLLVVAATLSFTGVSEKWGVSASQVYSNWLSRGSAFQLMIIAIGFGVLFLLLRIDKLWLGDAPAVLSNLANDNYMSKGTSPLIVPIHRLVQTFLGGVNLETAILSYQIVSVASGVISVGAFFNIARLLSESPSTRLLTTIVLLTSGALLLFFGYMENYALFWAAMSCHFACAFHYLKTKRGVVWVIATFLFMSALHLQSLYFAPGLVLLFWRPKGIAWLVPTLTGFVVLALAVSQLVPALASLSLPIWNGHHRSPDYAIFTPRHLLDIANLFFAVFPTILILLWLSRAWDKKIAREPMFQYLLFSAVGSLLFLLIINPQLGLGRDWDLFSATLFAPILLLLYMIGRGADVNSARLVIPLLVIGACATISFCASTINASSGFARYQDLLKHYGSKDRTGWIILGTEYLNRKEQANADATFAITDSLFPEYRIMSQAAQLWANGRNAEAISLVKPLLEREPDNTDMIGAMARLYFQIGNVVETERLIERGLRLQPFHYELNLIQISLLMSTNQAAEARVKLAETLKRYPDDSQLNELLAVSELRQGRFRQSDSIAVMMLRRNNQDPAGHLLKLILNLQHGDTLTAQRHYQAFLTTGKSRPDYSDVISQFGFLGSDSLK